MMQLDLFAPAPSTAKAVRGADEDWNAFKARLEAAKGVDRFETLSFGEGGRGRWGKAGYTLELWHDVAGPTPGWRVSVAISVHNSGSSGPFGCTVWPSKDSAVVDAFRSVLGELAHTEAMEDGWEDCRRRAVDLRKIVAWCLEQAPIHLVGVDLASELEVMRAAAIEKEGRRRAMLHAKDRIEQAASVALWREGEGPYTGPSRSPYRELMDHSDGLAWQDRFVAEYHVTGAMPDRLEVVVYGHGKPSSAAIMAMAVERISAGVDVPVRLATEGEYVLCKSDREKIAW
jgi:hypothetical protein